MPQWGRAASQLAGEGLFLPRQAALPPPSPARRPLTQILAPIYSTGVLGRSLPVPGWQQPHVLQQKSPKSVPSCARPGEEVPAWPLPSHCLTEACSSQAMVVSQQRMINETMA